MGLGLRLGVRLGMYEARPRSATCCRHSLSQNMSRSVFLKRSPEVTPRPPSWKLHRKKLMLTCGTLIHVSVLRMRTLPKYELTMPWGAWLCLYVAAGVLLSEPLFSVASGTGVLCNYTAGFDVDLATIELYM